MSSYTSQLHTMTTVSISNNMPPTTVPTTVPVLTDPSLTDVVWVVELGNMMALDTVAVVDIVILVGYGSNGDETDNVDDSTDGNKVATIVE